MSRCLDLSHASRVTVSASPNMRFVLQKRTSLSAPWTAKVNSMAPIKLEVCETEHNMSPIYKYKTGTTSGALLLRPVDHSPHSPCTLSFCPSCNLTVTIHLPTLTDYSLQSCIEAEPQQYHVIDQRSIIRSSPTRRHIHAGDFVGAARSPRQGPRACGSTLSSSSTTLSPSSSR